jgi:lipopolysaccharide transport system ATP-binding protein
MTDSIEIKDLCKRYRIGTRTRHFQLREELARLIKRPSMHRNEDAEAIWAIRDVSFNVREGEVVGIIGQNGAGKSTLLKMLSRITYPTSGSVKVKGRVAALLEVGVGFHNELTGRENVYLNGSILGLRKREIDERFDAIVDFAGVEQFIDTQIKHYSSGMRLRLGFAVAAHLDPDVLIVDEVLAVGDAGFQKKCVTAMEDLRSGGRTVLFVSHNMSAVENLCSRGIWIDGGRVRMDGPAKDVINSYMATFAGGTGARTEFSKSTARLGTGEIRYTRVEYLEPDGSPCTLVRCGSNVVFRFHYSVKKVIHNPSFGLRIYTTTGTLVTETGNLLHGVQVPKIEPGEGFIEVEIASLNLLPSRYSLSLWITGPDGGQPIYDGDLRTVLELEPANIFSSGREPNSRMGITYLPQLWRFSETKHTVLNASDRAEADAASSGKPSLQIEGERFRNTTKFP